MPERLSVVGAEVEVVGVGGEPEGGLTQSVEGFVHALPILEHDDGVFKAAPATHRKFSLDFAIVVAL
jgi:hypothetical protein